MVTVKTQVYRHLRGKSSSGSFIQTCNRSKANKKRGNRHDETTVSHAEMDSKKGEESRSRNRKGRGKGVASTRRREVLPRLPAEGRSEAWRMSGMLWEVLAGRKHSDFCYCARGHVTQRGRSDAGKTASQGVSASTAIKQLKDN